MCPDLDSPIGKYAVVCDDVVLKVSEARIVLRLNYAKWVVGPIATALGVVIALSVIHALKPIPAPVIMLVGVMLPFVFGLMIWLCSVLQRRKGPFCVYDLSSGDFCLPRQHESFSRADIDHIQVVRSCQRFGLEYVRITELNVVCKNKRRYNIVAMFSYQAVKKIAITFGELLHTPVRYAEHS